MFRLSPTDTVLLPQIPSDFHMWTLLKGAPTGICEQRILFKQARSHRQEMLLV